MAPASLVGCASPGEDGAAATTTKALGAHQPQRVLGARIVGRVASNAPMDLVLGLKLPNRAALERLIVKQHDVSSAEHDHHLTIGEFAERYAISPADYDGLAAALQRNGFQITQRVDGRSTLSVHGTAADVERYFSTELDVYEDAKGPTDRFFASSARFTMPPELEPFVDEIVGLNDATHYRSRIHSRAPGSVGGTPNALPSYADPNDLRTLYNVTTAVHPGTLQPLQGAGETVAILGTGTPPMLTDVAGFVSTYHLPTVVAAQYTQVLVGGANRDPAAFVAQEESENVLDIDMVLAMAPLANVVHVFTAANGGGLFADGITFVVNQVPHAHTVTLSYGTCERFDISEVLLLNSLFLQAQSIGQAWFVASGDDGTDGCQDASRSGVPAVDWPASSEYVFGVGGTAIASGKETTWFAGGSGLSEIFPKPTWQAGLGPYPNVDSRSVPDVSALAGDPGVATYFHGSLSAEEGTSAAAPIWGGVWALVDEARNNVGMADYHERIYALGKLNTGAFHDITTGDNTNATPGYPSLPGFDVATGWGTPNVTLLVGGLP